MLAIMCQLIRADLQAFRRVVLSEFIDLMIWVMVTAVVLGYLMPLFGVPHDFVLLSLSGIVASSVSFRIFVYVSGTVVDFANDRTISQRHILPIPAWAVFLAQALSFLLETLLLCVWVLPVAKLLLWDSLPLEQVSWWRFGLIFVVSSAFFAVFALQVASLMRGPEQIGMVFSRILFPLWFFGGFQFSWEKLHSIAPKLALIDLANPYLHMMEANRAALLGQGSNLPFCSSVTAMLVLTVLSAWHAFKKLRSKLDFV